MGPYERENWIIGILIHLTSRVGMDLWCFLHISMLWQYMSDSSHMLKVSEIEMVENLNYVGKPVILVDYRVKQCQNCGISMDKMIWRNYGIERTWCRQRNFEDKILKWGREMQHPWPKILSSTCIYFGFHVFYTSTLHYWLVHTIS